jgi:hypothetical protein
MEWIEDGSSFAFLLFDGILSRFVFRVCKVWLPRLSFEEADYYGGHGQSPSWNVQTLGVEETAVLAMISPVEGAHLLSGAGDSGGFCHDDLNVSPVQGMFTNPMATSTASLDWAGQSPLTIVRTQFPSSLSTSPCN